VSVLVVLGEVVEELSAVGVVVLFDELSPLLLSLVVPVLVLFPLELSIVDPLLLSPSPLPVLLEEVLEEVPD